ncbi:uncharacterized protein F4822DRAFT_434893 [Hypoxylon trugodes]|uniref:uncharacterized protein n=1 Tax=Hypoxylon trugodes TaxID=326681 RepID=UPI002191FACD|nr:uncharacterized protein F4822DRAFT_434893 [Hypoxylon trugodes]KAI1382965.1 hypothetical protein F4822DRAFT_434893 [Hypoxylon trugodes]
MSNTTDRTPLLPYSAHAESHHSQSSSDSHPIYLRACHSSWRAIDQRFLLLLRFVFTSYLSAVFGVALKYKLETEDEHTRWRIPFQFSSVAFLTQWAWHMQTTLWTAMHLAFPKAIEVDPRECHGHKARAYTLRFLSPPNRANCSIRRYLFSMFYTTAHVFPFMNTLLYWGVLVPTGHGGFKAPKFPHRHETALPNGNVTIAYDPSKGLFDEDTIKSFSLINMSTITSVIALIEIGFLNSIRRQTPVTAHAVGVMFASGAYLAWAGLGKIATGHSGIFFLDPELMKDAPESIIAACIAFVAMTPGVLTYMYGLVAMRETLTAAHHDSSR